MRLLEFGLLAGIESTKLRFESSELKYETKHFPNLIDHFEYSSNATYQMRYLVNSDYWKPDSKAPVFFYTGNEGQGFTFGSFLNTF